MPSGYTFDSSHGPGVGLSSSGGSNRTSGGSSSSGSSGSSLSSKLTQAAQNISNIVSTNTSMVGQKMREYLEPQSTSAKMANLYDAYIGQYGNAYDMDEYYEKMLEMAQYNNDWSAAQAEKQMAYQTRSDQAAMAWSAQEAAKSREWTENLSNTAHQREVKDLLAAGINPILSANGGAWSGSGATGQSHSSAGAMGQTDMTPTQVLGSMISNQMMSAKDIAITKMQTDAQKYNTDQQFAMAKMAAETSIFNNNNNIDANKAIRALDRDADIRKANISANAQMAAAAATAGGMINSANISASAARDVAQKNYETSKYKADTDYNIEKYKHDNLSADNKYRTNHNIWSDPVQYGNEAGKFIVDSTLEIADMLGEIGNRKQQNYNGGTD